MVSAGQRSCSGRAAPPGWPEGLWCLPSLGVHPYTRSVGGATTQRQDSFLLLCAERSRGTQNSLENNLQHVSATTVRNRFHEGPTVRGFPLVDGEKQPRVAGVCVCVTL